MSVFIPELKQLKKVKKLKQLKEIKSKPSKVEKNLSETEYIENLIQEKIKLIDSKTAEIHEIQKVINSLNNKQLNEDVLNERCILINKISNKLIKLKDKSNKEALYNEMMKDIDKFDKYFDIDSNKLLGCDLKY